MAAERPPEEPAENEGREAAAAETLAEGDDRERADALGAELVDRRSRDAGRLSTEFLVRRLHALLLPVARRRLEEECSLLPAELLTAAAVERATLEGMVGVGAPAFSERFEAWLPREIERMRVQERYLDPDRLRGAGLTADQLGRMAALVETVEWLPIEKRRIAYLLFGAKSSADEVRQKTGARLEDVERVAADVAHAVRLRAAIWSRTYAAEASGGSRNDR